MTSIIYMTEYQNPETGKWFVVENGWRRGPRDNMLYARLAGINNDWGVVAAAPDRGIPLDSTSQTSYAWHIWDMDGKHPSWISGEEYAEKVSGVNDELDRLLRYEVRKHRKEYALNECKFRIVFWFWGLET